jgi:hypothetical protein
MATGGLIGALRVTLGIDTAAFESGSKRAAATAKRDAGLISKAYSTAGDHIKTAMGALTAALSVGALVAAASRALDYASSLAEVAQQLGVTTKDLQEYRYAATQVGISQETMDKGLAKLTVSMGQARAGVEKPKAAFKELSDLLGKDVLKSAQTAGDAIPLISDALAKVKDPSARAALEVALFGKAGQQLDTLLASGSAAIDGLRDAAQRLGLVLSEEQIANADNTADKLGELKQVLEANIAGAVANNATAILALADALETLIVKAGRAAEAYANFQNLQGYKGGDMASGAALGKSKSGRATLLNYLDDQIVQNTRDRATGRGGRKSYLGGLIQVTGSADDAANRKLDDDFKRLTARRNAVQHLDSAADRVAGLPKPGTPGAGAGTSDASASAAAAKLKAAQEKAARLAEKQARDREKQVDRFNSEMAGLEDDEIGLSSNLTTDIEERAEFERQRVKNEAEAYTLELASKVKLGELLPAQAKRLQIGKNFNTNLELDLINQKRDDDLTKQALDTKDAGLGLQADLLRGELSEAKTQAERRTLQGQLLDIEYDRQRAALESVLALNSSTDAEKKIAQARLDQIDVLKAHDAETNRRDTAGPMEAFGESLHRTAGQIKEDLEQIEVDGIKSLNDGLVDAIVNSKSLGDVFSNVAKQIMADIIKIGLQEAESSIFGKSGSGGGGLSGLIAGIGSIFGGKGNSTAAVSAGLTRAGSGPPGLAGGGTVQVTGSGGIDTNLMSINGQPAARVNRGEHIKVVPNNDNDGSRAGGGVMEVRLRDEMLDARIVSGSSRVTQAGIQQNNSQQSKYAGRRLGR